MTRTTWIGLTVLLVYLYSGELGSIGGSDVPIIKNQLPIITALMAHSTNAQLRILSWQMSARDDQTEDCLRAGICRD